MPLREKSCQRKCPDAHRLHSDLPVIPGLTPKPKRFSNCRCSCQDVSTTRDSNGEKMKLNSFILGLVAIFCLSGVASADSLTSTGSATVNVSASLTVTSNNCATSSSICYQSATSGNSTSAFGITVPGITLPTGSTITGASLAFSFPGTTSQGGYSITSASPVVTSYQYYAGEGSYSCGFLSTCYYPIYYTEYYPYNPPSYAVNGSLNGTFTSLASTDTSSSLFDPTSGTLDLLALGFGSDLAAGDSLVLSGVADSNLTFGYTNTGYNAYSTAILSANLSGAPQATLEIDYTTDPLTDPTSTPEPGTWMMLGISLLTVGGFAKRR